MTKATHIAKFVVFLTLCGLLPFAGAQSYGGDNYSLQTTTTTPVIGAGSIINSGFETGTFNPWVNVGGTAYNTIQTGTVYSGTYAVFLDSQYAYYYVEQTLQETLTLANNPLIAAAINPAKVGPTAEQAGVSCVFLTIEDVTTSEETWIYYIWSGYTYPGNDIDANITWAAYNIFDWTPNQWNILNRSILADYIAVLGVPTNPSDLVVTKVSLVAHNSNGDPGDFYADDVKFSTVLPAATTSQPQPWDASGMIVMLVSIGGGGLILIGLVGYFLIVKPRRRRGVAELSEPQATPASAASVESDVIVQALRGGEFVGNRFRFKVKVLNKSPFVITDITVGLIAYPKDTLRIEGELVKNIAKLEPNGFRSPTFEFLPTEDCVKGDIIASVSYVDSRGNAHSITTMPFTIRAVCDLLRPESISPKGFMLKLAALDHGEIMSRVEDWTPEEMHEKTLNILRDSNFFEVTSDLSQVGDDHVESKIKGWAEGIYTGNNLGVQVTITGRPGVKGATCKVRMSGEDKAMIMPAIDEISQKLSAWLCPKCSGALPVELVNELKAGKSVSCPFCSVTMDR